MLQRDFVSPLSLRTRIRVLINRRCVWRSVASVALFVRPLIAVAQRAPSLRAVNRVPGPPADGNARGGDSTDASRLLAAVQQLARETSPLVRAQRYTLVQTNVAGRDLGGFASEVQRAVSAQVTPPPGVFITYGGAFENQRRAMARLQVVVPLSIALIALLLWASLQSWWLAGLVLVNLPFAAVGGVLALWARGLHLSVSASIGFIALFGVAVLNGLVLLTTVQRTRQHGASPLDAAISGARSRLRPVLMTALVASLGFIPVALSHGTGAEVQRPLATVVIGGLITSTLLTLFVLPTLYAWIEQAITDRRERRRNLAPVETTDA